MASLEPLLKNLNVNDKAQDESPSPRETALALSTLPPEILSEIFKEAQCTHMLSRSLLSYGREQLYHVVRVDTYLQLKVLHRTLMDDQTQALGELISDFTILNEDECPKVPEEPLYTETTELLCRMPRLKTLRLELSHKFTLSMLAEACAKHLQQLADLALFWTDESYLFGIDPSSYTSLHEFPKLVKLHLSPYAGPNALLQTIWKIPVPPTLNSTIRVVHFYLADSLTCHYAKSLLGFFSKMELLALVNKPSVPLFPSLTFSNLNGGLKNLILMHHGPSATLPVVLTNSSPLELIIGRFSHLKFLELVGGSYTSALFPLLKTLPLEQLALSTTAFATFQDLLQLLHGINKVDRLSLLEVDFFKFDKTQKPSILEVIGPLIGEGDISPWCKRGRPVWYPDFTFENAKDLFKAAEEASVELLGSIIDVCDAQAFYDLLEEEERKLMGMAWKGAHLRDEE